MKKLINKYNIFLLICFFIQFKSNSQGLIATNSREAHNSSVVDLSNNNLGKAFVAPRVVLNELTNTVSPISNPAEGLIVYNTGTANIQGYYIFQNATWNLLATRENSVMNAIFKRNETSFTISSTYASASSYSQLFNNTGGGIALNGNQITLSPGKYVVNIMYNIITDETSTNSIGNSNGRVHTHFYKGRLWTGSTALGGEVLVNEISSTNGNKSHNAYFIYSFQISETTSFSVQLARNTGGTYNGTNLVLKDSYIHIEKSLQ